MGKINDIISLFINKPNLSRREIASLTNSSYGYTRNIISNYKNTNGVKTNGNSNGEEAELLSLRADVRKLKGTIQKLKVAKGDTSRFFDSIMENVSIATPLIKQYKSRAKTSKSNMTACVHFTDWHTGEVVNPTEVDDFNDYNPDIQEAGIEKICNTLIEYIILHREVYNINELVIICTGDFISGDIHSELFRTNAYPVPMQTCEAGRLLAQGVGMLAPYFDKVRVEFMVPDNHGRLAKKVQFKEAGINSYNYIVGFIAKQMLIDHDNIEFNIHPQLWKAIEVEGYRFLCSHGHMIRGWAGFPYYGIDRQTGRQAKKRINKPADKRFHKMLIGHFHAPVLMEDWMIGGSLSGTTELDHGVGREAEPCQTAWFQHKNKGIVNYLQLRTGR